MIYTAHYNSPLGKILLAADKDGLIGLWFENQKYYADVINENTFCHEIDIRKGQNYGDKTDLIKDECVNHEVSVLKQTKEWLDIYFSGGEPHFTPRLHMIASDFRKAVWNIMLEIPYGQTMTYGEIARKLAKQKCIKTMSAQAVGGAVGHNSISIIIPCHRVVGTNGSLTGYAGGIDKKVGLLTLENVDMSRFFIPRKGRAL